ncbi:rhomboid family intramembrane serine protease [Clostridium sp. JN-1]|uniref:rhomboid family intramembrane serine protease n=1 Tax=Clostridium sp. JN-1 TaxID=2483110 RepID=UPI000F0BA45E|nr:rhomboid family intramembrane serine protease [Clostridium sp. JN-1]
MKNRIHYNSPVILTFSFLAFGVLLLGMLTQGISTKLFFTSFRTSFYDPLQYLRLFTYILGHANWAHFSSNFIIILLVGPMVEEKYGSKELFKMIIFTAFLTGFINITFSNNALLGASGIVFMLILLSSFANVKHGEIPLTLILVVIVFMGKEIFSGLFIQDNIAHSAHIIGGLCGGVFGYLKNRKKLE